MTGENNLKYSLPLLVCRHPVLSPTANQPGERYHSLQPIPTTATKTMRKDVYQPFPGARPCDRSQLWYEAAAAAAAAAAVRQLEEIFKGQTIMPRMAWPKNCLI